MHFISIFGAEFDPREHHYVPIQMSRYMQISRFLLLEFKQTTKKKQHKRSHNGEYCKRMALLFIMK